LTQDLEKNEGKFIIGLSWQINPSPLSPNDIAKDDDDEYSDDYMSPEWDEEM
jgi:hypothetical protein